MKLRSGCIGVGSLSACGEDKRKCMMLFLDNMSAAVLDTPGICSIVISISKRAVKNHIHLSKCITVWSFEEPFLIAATNPVLSHWKSVCFVASLGPHTMQLSMIGANSLAIIPTDSHSGGHDH